MPKRADTLILGASGFVGRALLATLGPECALGTYCKTPLAGAVRFDALVDDIAGLLDRYGPFRRAFILYAESRIDACARAPARAYALNVESVTRIADALQDRGVLPVFASSDSVFDGTRGNYTEEDAADPILAYGRHKREVERRLAASGRPYIAARLSKVVDADPAGPGMLGEWIRWIGEGREIFCATDQKFSAIDLRDVVAALIALADRAPPGLYNVGGPKAWDRASLFEVLLRAIRRHADIPAPKMRRCGINDFPQFLEPRPIDISMCSDRLVRATGIAPRAIEETCAEIAAAAYSKKISP